MATPLNGLTTAPSDLEIVEISPHGDILLDVTFETSKPVILAAKKAYAAFTSKPRPTPSRSTPSRSTTKPTSSSSQTAKTPAAGRPPRPPPKPRVRVGFRVHLSVLKEHSPYFARLLSDTRFAEAKAVEEALEKLRLDGVNPGEVDWTRLPRVTIREDDEATQSAEVREVFEDLLYLLHHGKLPVPVLETPTEERTGEEGRETSGEGTSEPEPEPKAAESKTAESKTVPARTVKAATKTAAPTKRPGQPPSKPPTKTQPNGLRKPLDKPPPPKSRPNRPKTPTDPATPQAPQAPQPSQPSQPSQPFQPSQPSTPSPGPPPLPIPYLTTLALIADRFSLLPSLCRLQLSSLSQIKWPSTPVRITKEQDGHALTLASEELLRQKILVAWLLDFPLKFQAACRELVLFGSRRWTLAAATTGEEGEEGEGEDDGSGGGAGGAGAGSGIRWKARWWTLPDNLEDELSYRRTCLLSVLASIPRHFLRLYIVRPPQTRSITTSSAGIGASFTSNAAFAMQAAAQGRQCKLGYESSMSCDSYQLGEMVRFLCTKGLLSLVDFSPMSFDRAIEQYDGGENPLAKVDNNNPGGGVVLFGPPKPSASKADSGGLGGISTMEINHFVAILRQCPSYQIDRNHTNCGLRTRMFPVLEYVQAMLASEVILIKRADWEKRREEVSWVSLAEKRGEESEGKKRVFRFTRNLATDPRMRYSTTMGTSKIAMDLFLADEWDWTAEEY
ncbi:hypothetical protein B0T20DRAFT_54098 [Sordaria brevicollis]|uniref:BTB domain-containing protein n=1 Tax=Sordaria brevicollis TaxID=83679 RepID=A0AAE0P2Z0_SORBR|nr:hypothetical protein B0T20DRAFT_54098 [Sordaria brevicollis]